MTRLERADQIEATVGARRHMTVHLGRAVSAEQRVYILHSHDCVNLGIDLRTCAYSIALDNGIRLDEWDSWQDQPVALTIAWTGTQGELLPLRLPSDAALAAEAPTTAAGPIDPDCRDGKHLACPGWTLGPDDDFTDCACGCHDTKAH